MIRESEDGLYSVNTSRGRLTSQAVEKHLRLNDIQIDSTQEELVALGTDIASGIVDVESIEKWINSKIC